MIGNPTPARADGGSTLSGRVIPVPCSAVASRPAALQQGSHALTISLGLTLCVPGDTPDTALHRADQAMYQAKERGRNRVELQLFAWA